MRKLAMEYFCHWATWAVEADDQSLVENSPVTPFASMSFTTLTASSHSEVERKSVGASFAPRRKSSICAPGRLNAMGREGTSERQYRRPLLTALPMWKLPGSSARNSLITEIS